MLLVLESDYCEHSVNIQVYPTSLVLLKLRKCHAKIVQVWQEWLIQQQNKYSVDRRLSCRRTPQRSMSVVIVSGSTELYEK